MDNLSDIWAADGLGLALLEQFDDAAALLDGQGRIVCANERFAELIGRVCGTCAGSDFTDLFQELERAGRQPCTAAAAKPTSGRTLTGDPVEIDWRPLAGGRASALALVRRGEAGIAEEPEPAFYRSLVENLPGMVFRRILHDDGHLSLEYASPGVERFAGISAGAVCERPEVLSERLQPEDRGRIEAALQASAASLQAYTIDVRLLTAGGSIRWLRDIGTSKAGPAGSTIFDGIVLDITELKEHEAELESAEERFREITLSGSDWIFETDEELRYTYLSERFSELTGIAREEILGRNREEVYGANLEQPVWQAHLDDLRARRPYRDRVFEVGAGGQRRWFRTSGAPIFERGFFKGYRGVASEITSQMLVQERLRESEERFRDIVEASSDWIWEMDAELRFTFLSDRFQQVTGIDPANVIGRTRKDYAAPVNDPEIWQAHYADLEARRPFREFRYLYRDGAGRLRFQKVSGVPIFDAGGNFTGYRGTGTDITAQVEAEHRLKESEQRFRHFTEAASDWVWEMDAELRFTFISDRLHAMTGSDPAWMIGKTRADVAARSTNPEVWQDHLADLEARRPFKQFRYTFRTEHGREFEMSISGSPIFDGDGTFRGYRGTATDITAQVRAERAAARHQALLAQAVDALAHGFALFDDQDRLVLCNEKYYRVLGFEGLPVGTPFKTIVKDAIGLGLRSERVPDTAALEQDFWSRHQRADGVPQEFSLANGHWIRSSKSLLPNGYKVTVQVDVTEMKRREQALKDSEARFRGLADATFEGLLVHDGRTIVDVNKAFLQLAGITRETAMSERSLGDFFSRAEKVLARDEGGVFETVLNLGEGRELPVEAQCKTVPFQGRPVRVVAMRDISERRRAEAHIRHLAHHDGLTSLPNRLRFQERLLATLEEHNRSGKRLAILQLDLDNFKDVNDTLGHHAGDVLLCEVGERLRDCVRQSDTVARLGGDEFAILLGGLERGADAAAMAQRIVNRLRDPVDYQGHTIHPGTSIGVTIFPDDDRDPEQLQKNADIALYRAKSNGRNGYSFFVSSMKVAVEHRRTLEGELRRALERSEFRLLYQPQIDVGTGRIVGIEALLRWAHPEHGLLAPNAFLAVAEETGLIVPIGQMVMRVATRQAKLWQDLGFDFGRIAINVAAHQFKIGNLVRRVREVLLDTGLPPERLEIEITEGVFLGRGSEGVAEALRRLARLKVRIALDDFGTGYASLAHLKRFPIDRLKIDQSFVRDIGIDADDAAIVRTVLSLGDALGLEVVAEGVETVAQQRFLREHGCRVVQGYLFSQPLEPHEMTLFLEGSVDGRTSEDPIDVLAVEPA